MAADGKFRQDCIDAHNKKREMHGVPPQRLVNDLNASAQAWADKIAQSGQFGHSQNRDNVGENIAMKWESDPTFVFTGNDATEQWYGEVAKYTYGTENPNCGHFSQVVWKSSIEVGFGRSKGADGKAYIVGQYRPAGNMMGEWKDNVLAPQKENVAPAAAPAPAAAAPTDNGVEKKKKKKKGGLFSCFKKSKTAD